MDGYTVTASRSHILKFEKSCFGKKRDTQTNFTSSPKCMANVATGNVTRSCNGLAL